ncbi:endocuticle structural glycoprotein SgAbd-2-like [Pollicipes pollicipes]|uniref:endocuticle structural glycoprotein SgAbd-2-like n=1 Tax=Pollicipes pollicipes TaxID=41117 RepID=UPI0018854836|nr:endocuticle structural glycoprotein SgAbd-2-like [Pollicipes pollicipes]
MRCLTCFLLAWAAAAAVPRRPDPEILHRRRAEAANAQILQQQTVKTEDGSYSLSFRTDNGIVQKETGTSFPGTLPESGTYVKEGVIEYVLDDGTPITLLYVADENGFEILNPDALQQVLPTPPPTEYPLPKVPGAGMPVPEPLPQFNVGLFRVGGTVSPQERL